MLRFRRQDEVEISDTKYTSRYGLQYARQVELPPFNIMLDGSSNTINNIYLLKLNASNAVLKSFNLDASIVSYNSTYDLLYGNGNEFGEVPTGKYKVQIITDDEIWTSEVFKICEISIPKILLQIGGEDDVLIDYMYIENGGNNDNLSTKKIISNGGFDRV